MCAVRNFASLTLQWVPSMPVDTIFIEEFLCLLLVLIGWVTPVVVAAQDSTTIEVAQPAAKTTAIKWWEAGAVVGGGLLTMAVVDGPVQEWSSNPDHYHQATDDLANAFQLFGAPAVVYPVSGAIILVGLVAKKPGLFHSGLRIGASVLLAGVVTEGAKLTFGRVRPDDTNDVWDYQPFSGNGSLWSGHTALAFSFATSLSQEVHRTWVTVGLYAVATGTAWSRVYENEHWVSDVLIGAAMGITSAKLATGRWTIFGLRAPVPLATPNGLGVMWHGTF